MIEPIDEVAGLLGDQARPDVALGPLTTYRVGGPAALLVEVVDEATLASVVDTVHRTGVDVLVVGRGSNLLVADAGFAGLAVVLGDAFGDVEVRDTIVRAGAAASLPVVARRTAAAALTGFEWAVGVPGSIGGAVRMNAGGHGSDMAATLRRVRVADLALGEDGVVTSDRLELGYRRSSIAPSQVVVWAELELVPGERETSEATIADIVRWRRENQPGGANAGSVFTNPDDDSAGRLVEESGAKGLRWGTAAVSEKHANFIQADDGGSADDVASLMAQVRRQVRERNGVELVAETRLVGFAPEVLEAAGVPRIAWRAVSTTTVERRRARVPVDESELDIDPRIADRRSAVQREHRRKRLRTLVLLSIVTVIALAGVGLTRSAALDVDHIDVVGADRTAIEGMIGASGLSFGAPMTELDLEGARQAIAELPWIDDVRVKRQWPNRISIAVRERVPVAAVPAADAGWALVDDEGHVLAVSDAVSERWVHIDGLEPAGGPGAELDDAAADALAVAASLRPDLRAGLERIEVDDGGELWLHYATGPKVRLGGVDHLDDKLAAVQSVFDQVDPCGLDVIDARAVDPIAVTRVPSCRAGATAGADASTATGDAPGDAATSTDPEAAADDEGAAVEPAPVEQPVVESDVDG